MESNKDMQQLDDRIAKYTQSHSVDVITKKSQYLGLKIAMNCSLEIISGIVVGVCFGYYLDKYFNSKFLFIIFTMLGFCAGLLNLYRYIKYLGVKNEL